MRGPPLNRRAATRDKTLSRPSTYCSAQACPDLDPLEGVSSAYLPTGCNKLSEGNVQTMYTLTRTLAYEIRLVMTRKLIRCDQCASLTPEVIPETRGSCGLRKLQGNSSCITSGEAALTPRCSGVCYAHLLYAYLHNFYPALIN